MGLLAVAAVAISLPLRAGAENPRALATEPGPGSECEEPAGNGVGFMERRLPSPCDTGY